MLSHTPDCKLVGTKKVKNLGGVPDETSVKTSQPSFTSSDRTSTVHHFDEDGFETVEKWLCAGGCPVAILDEQSGVSNGDQRIVHHKSNSGFVDDGNGYETMSYGDIGGASRFFFNSDWSYEIAEQIDQAVPFFYQSKASRFERDAGLQELPKKFLATMGDGIGAREHNPNESTAWVRNIHPTLKPISLCKHLATLLLPPAAYAPRRILIPFCGSGSEMIACVLSGWEEVIGIEISGEYCTIARARLSWWTSRMQETGSTDPPTILHSKRSAKKQDNQQPIGNPQETQAKESVVQPTLL